MRAPRQAQVIVGLLALGAASLPVVGAAHAAGTDYALQVSPEVSTVGAGEEVTLTATIDREATETVKVRFDGLNGPAAGVNTSCVVDPGETTCSAPPFARNGNQGVGEVRAFIEGQGQDTDEARLANTDSGGLFGFWGNGFAADCQPGDAGGGGGLLGGGGGLLGGGGGGQVGECKPEGAPVDAGDTAEPDGTDVVQVGWSEFADARIDCDDRKPADGQDVEYNNAAVGGAREETYDCRVTRVGSPNPVDAWVDAKVLSGSGIKATGTPAADQADLNDGCRTGSDGRCQVTIEMPAGAKAPWAATVCFWAEPLLTGEDVDPQTAPGQDNKYNPAGLPTDGSACAGEKVSEAEGNDLGDAVRLDVDNPRPAGIDAGPEFQTAKPGSRFSLVAVVYDQFSNVLRGAAATVNVELFDGSKLDTDGNDPSTADYSCTTNGSGTCVVNTRSQSALGPNTACLWVGAAPKSMLGIGGDRGECDGEGPVDPTGEGDGNHRPSPITDARDVIRFTVQSRPLVSGVKPKELRQDSRDLLRVSGINFEDGARVTVSGKGVKVGPAHVVSASLLEADLTVAEGAPAGVRDVVVTNLDGGTTTCRRCFAVIGQGYWMVAADGGIFAFGDAPFHGSTGGSDITSPVVGMASTPSGDGYWMVSANGAVRKFGDAPHVGDAAGFGVHDSVVGIAAHPSGRGYWIATSDGFVYGFGEARFYGHVGFLDLAQPIVGIAALPSGKGYWLVAADGGVFSFGLAKFHGSTGAIKLNKPIVGMTATNSGKGYWMVATDGGIFAFGDAAFYGSMGSVPLNKPVVGMTTTPKGGGYWLVATDGGIFSFGDAAFHGSTGSITLNSPIWSIARR